MIPPDHQPPTSSRFRRTALAGVAVAALLAGSAVADAETPEELREERREVQAEAAAVAIDVDTLTGDAQEVSEALSALQASVDSQEAALDAARRAVTEAEEAQAEAEKAVAELLAEKEDLETVVRHTAVEAFVSFQAPAGEVDPLGSDPWRQARDEALVEFATGTHVDAVDALRTIGSELESQEQRAEEAAADADARRTEVEERLADLEVARDQEATLLADVESRLDARLSEAAALESLDAELSEEIRVEEKRIADAIAAQQAAQVAAAAANTGGPTTGGGGGGSSSGGGSAFVVPANPSVSLTTVGGITVNSSIASQTQGLLSAMAAEGFVLGGGGYRSSDSQVSLRQSNCGSSQYAIWEMPASQCRPPTARPGQSAHEQGLAIDFTHGGSIIRSRSSAVFQALARVAPGYGFINLPSEPWHWSVTGS